MNTAFASRSEVQSDAVSGSFTRAAGLTPDPVSLEPYRSEAFMELERDRLFGRAWLPLARQEELPEPGHYVVRDIEILKASVIVSRGKDGSIRAFHNVCSHRGNQVLWDREGKASRFVCRYHNWTYASDGRLIGVPDEASFEALDKGKCGMTPIACEVWNGFVFVNMERKPSTTLKEFLGGLGEYLDGIQCPYADNPIVIESYLQCNWKVALDAFSESYHIPAIHKKTLAPTMSSPSNQFSHLLSAKFFGPHCSVAMYGNPDYQADASALVEKLAYDGMGTASVVAGGRAQDIEEYLSHPAVNSPRSNSWVGDVHIVFPNTHIDTGGGGLFTHQFWPLTVNSCRYEARLYVPHASDVRMRLMQELYVARFVEVILEDLSNVGRTQKGIASGGKDFMVLQDNEVTIRHSAHHIAKWAGATTVEEALA